MKKQSVLRLASLLFLVFTIGQPAHAGDFLRWLLSGFYNAARDGEMFYSELAAEAIGDGKVYVHWPTRSDEEISADEIEVVGSDVVYTEESPFDDTARGGKEPNWPYTHLTYSDHSYVLYAEAHPGFEVDGVYRDEACTNAYNFPSGAIFEGDGYTAYSVTFRTEATTRATAENLTLYVRFALNVTLNSRGYSTLYYSKYNFKVPTGVTATTYKLGDGYGKLEESRVYSPGDVIPAGEAVVLQGNAGTYKFYPVKTTSNTPDTENILRGTDVEEFTTGGTEYFALSYNSTKGVVGFYWMNSTGAAFKNGAHKAYLPLSGASGVKGFDFDGDDATGISNVNDNLNLTDGPIFNLAGQRVGKMQKGINIVNGKKILK